ncbi:MAG: GAF domain-containing protein [Pseudomonadota bacterium]
MDRSYRTWLTEQRDAAEHGWRCLVHDRGGDAADIRAEIAASWDRSQRAHPPAPVSHVPVDDAADVRASWRASPLYRAYRAANAELDELALSGGYVAALADASGKLLWTHASNHMLDRAESAHFTAGGHWGELSAGTNAVGLALARQTSVTVFSAEHYQPWLHDWVCYAAPIVHPATGELHGVLDLSTTWTRHTPIGQHAVNELARRIALHLPDAHTPVSLQLYALGRARALLHGKCLALSPRQHEILCLLALHPDGLGLEAFHAKLYGDRRVRLGTLKAELSHLRRLLRGGIGSRPYRLTLPFEADFIELTRHVARGDTSGALQLYRGPLAPGSDAPGLVDMRHNLDVQMLRILPEHHAART